MIDAQRVDFIAVPVEDRERAARFYGQTLDFRKNPNSTDTWVEFETGNVALALADPPSAGQPFAPLPFGAIVIRVPDVESAKAKFQDAGAVFKDSEGNGLAIHHRYAPYLDGTMP